MTLRLIFMGTPDFAVPALQALIGGPHQVVAVYSQPPRPAGRGHKVTPSPVHRLADAHGIAVRHPINFKDQADKDAFADLDADLAIVAAYGLILPTAILTAPRLGAINIHGSLLPRWRGAAPIQRSILAGDSETGITIMRMVRKLDAGAMLMKRAVPITAETTASGLHDALAALGAEMIGPAVEGVADGSLIDEQQDEALVTYAEKLTRDDGAIDWTASADRIDRQVRALTPWPGCSFAFQDMRVKLLRATPVDGSGTPGTLLSKDGVVACGEGALRLDQVQKPGKPPVPGDAFLRGVDWAVGELVPVTEPGPQT